MTDRMIAECHLIELAVRGDERGSLVAIEGRDLPFDIARVYYIFGTKPGVNRGFHGHRRLKQLAVCLSGSCTVVVDNGRDRASVQLDRPTQGLEIGPRVWREMTGFSDNCVLMVLASEPYDETDYIRDYNEFRQLVGSEHK